MNKARKVWRDNPSMLTKSEASLRWCPMARVLSNWSGDSVTVNRSESKGEKKEIEAACCCIADDCAMWRWAGENSDDEWHGYCGLAGRPK